MLLKHKNVLIAKRDVIVKDLRVTDVFSILRGKFVLTENDQEEILGETTSKGQAEKLLDILPLKRDDVDAFKWFLNSLEEKYPHLVCLLKEPQHVDNGDASNQNEGSLPMSQYHRDLLTSKRPQIVDDLLVGDILPYLVENFVFNHDDQQRICAETTDKLKAEKCLDLLPTRGDKAFGHFVDSLRREGGCEHLAQLLVTDDQEGPSRKSKTSVEREAANIRANLSKERNQWVVLGEILHLVRKPIVLYVKRIVESWHERLSCTDAIQLGTCTSPENCLEQKRVQDLCPSCSGWYSKLAANHRSENESQIRWRQNCDTSKWKNDPWEVAKFFMSSLGENKSSVRGAESTDLISLLNVLEWMKNEAFGENSRIPIVNVTELRKVRNKWAHSANQEVTEDQINHAAKVADEFINALSKVSVNEEVTDYRSDIQSLVADGSKKFQTCEDVSQVSQDIAKVDNTETVGNLIDQAKLINSRIKEVWQEVKRKNDMEAKEAKEKRYLPEKSSLFIGREKEIEDTISLLQDKMVGVVSIYGGPGIGKSTTAIEITHGLIDHHNIPVFFAYLSDATTTSEVIVCLCNVMGIQPQQDPKSSLIFYLRSIRTNCVLVMDNIEQLLEETTQDAFINLLHLLRTHSGKQLQILLTSRSRFVVSNLKSQVIHLMKLPRDLSIQLVRECHPGKCLNDRFVNSLAESCGDVPLALHIAASRLQDVSDPDDLLQWLQDYPLEVLKTPTEKVEKSIEMSFNRLSNQEKNYFVSLSVFDGNFEKNGVQEVTGLEGIHLQNFLTSLVDNSLLEHRGERYSIHTLIRSYLIKQGESDEFSPGISLSQGKMVKHFLNLCHKLTLLYWSKNGSTEARRLLQEDAHNVKKVLLLCQESVNESTNEEIIQSMQQSKIFQLLCRFFYHFVLHILPQPLILSFLDTCAKLAKKHKDAGIELLVHCLISHMNGRTSGWKSPEYAESIEVAKATYCRNKERLEKKSKLEACSYYLYNQQCCNKGFLPGDKARLGLQSYLDLKISERQSMLDEVDVAITLLQLGRVHSWSEKTEPAVDCYKGALRYFERLLGNHDLKLCCHKELGDLHHEQGDHAEAVSHYEDAMKVHRQLGASNSNISSVYLLKNYGLSLAHMSRMEEGIAYQREALDNAQKLFKNHPRCKIEVYCGLAETFDKCQNGRSKAVEFAKKALDTLGSNCYSSKGVNLKEKMSKIIDRGNHN